MITKISLKKANIDLCENNQYVYYTKNDDVKSIVWTGLKVLTY